MMKQLLLTAATALLLTGCATTLAPHSPYIPLLRQPGDSEARLSGNLVGSKLELQLGYQATERLVLHTALLHYRFPNSSTGFHSTELGLGYYLPLAGARWRLGLHAGTAYGRGTSRVSGCFECVEPRMPLSEDYDVRYRYAYVQPTALLRANDYWTWGVAVRLSRARYHRFTELRVDSTGGQPRTLDHAGHGSVFVQPTVLLSGQVARWLEISGSLSSLGFLGPESRLDMTSPLSVRIGLSFVLGKRNAPELAP